MYAPRKMRQSEFLTTDDMIKRDAKGALCGFAVEDHRGIKKTGLSWAQACDLAERMNDREAVAA